MTAITLIPRNIDDPMETIEVDVSDRNFLRPLVGKYAESIELPGAILFFGNPDDEEEFTGEEFNNDRANQLIQDLGVEPGDTVIQNAVVVGWDKETDTWTEIPANIEWDL